MDATSTETTYQVRRASDADLPAVLEVLAQNQPVAPTRPSHLPGAPSERQRTTWEHINATGDLTVYLAVHRVGDSEHGQDREQPVGTAAMLLMPHLTYDCRPSAFIEAVVIAYAHRRRGLARLLLHRALDDARRIVPRGATALPQEPRGRRRAPALPISRVCRRG